MADVNDPAFVKINGKQVLSNKIKITKPGTELVIEDTCTDGVCIFNYWSIGYIELKYTEGDKPEVTHKLNCRDKIRFVKDKNKFPIKLTFIFEESQIDQNSENLLVTPWGGE